MSLEQGRRNKQPVSVLNKVVGKDLGSPISADNVPVGMSEARTQADGGNLSANLGSERDSVKGGAYLFNASSYLQVIANDGDISSVSALNETGVVVSLTAVYSVDRYNITGIDGNYYWNIKCWRAGATPTNAQKEALTLSESVEADLFTWWKAQETNGNTVYKAYTAGVNGTVINNYAGFHTNQNDYSFANDLGFSDSERMLNKDFSDSDISMYVVSGPNPNDLTLSRNGNTLETEVSTLPSNADKTIAWKQSGSLFTNDFVYNGIIRWKVKFNATAAPTSMALSIKGDNAITRSTIVNDTWYEDNFSVDVGLIANEIEAKVIFPNHPDVLGAILVVDYVVFEAVKIPRDESNLVNDVLGNPLQYIGKCPSQADFVESPCFVMNGVGYCQTSSTINLLADFSISLKLRLDTTDTSIRQSIVAKSTMGLSDIWIMVGAASIVGDILRVQILLGSQKESNFNGIYSTEVGDLDDIEFRVVNGVINLTVNGESITNTNATPTPITNMEIDFVGWHPSRADFREGGCSICDLKVDNHLYPFSEPIKDAANHTVFDVVGGNHAILINGSLANEGVQDEFHYSQLGILDDGINQQVPILADLSAFADGSLLSDPNAILQDGDSFLNTGTKLAHRSMPRVHQADKLMGDFWFDNITELPNNLDFNAFQAITDFILFTDLSVTDKIKQLRTHKQGLLGRQLNTEKKITNNL